MYFLQQNCNTILNSNHLTTLLDVFHTHRNFDVASLSETDFSSQHDLNLITRILDSHNFGILTNAATPRVALVFNKRSLSFENFKLLKTITVNENNPSLSAFRNISAQAIVFQLTTKCWITNHSSYTFGVK